MTLIRAACCFGMVVVALCANAPQAGAQVAPRANTTVFRAASQQATFDPLVLTAGWYGAYDTRMLDFQNDAVVPGDSAGGPFSGLDLALKYAPPAGRRFAFDVRASTSVHYYPRLSDVLAATQSVSAAMSTRVSRRVTLRSGGGAGYQPYFDLAGFHPDAQPSEGLTQVRDGVMSRRLVTLDGFAEMAYERSRTWFTGRYSAASTELLGESRSSFGHTAGATFGRRIGRLTAARIEYARRSGEYDERGTHREVLVHDATVAIERTWNRSPTRRTMLTLRAGPSWVEHFGQRGRSASGEVALAHDFGRSWQMAGQYRRGVTFLYGESQPFVSDLASLSAAGALSRRTDLTVMVSGAHNSAGFTPRTGAIDALVGTVTLRHALGRSVAMFGEYTNVHYRYSRDYVGTSRYPDQVRHGMRIGLMYYVPLQRQRRAGKPAG